MRATWRVGESTWSFLDHGFNVVATHTKLAGLGYFNVPNLGVEMDWMKPNFSTLDPSNLLQPGQDLHVLESEWKAEHLQHRCVRKPGTAAFLLQRSHRRDV